MACVLPAEKRHLHFFWIPNGVMAFFTPKPEHQSYNGRMHGGLITVLLDEIMGNYLFKKEGVPAYTARIDLRFRTPVQIGTTIRCEGHEVKRKAGSDGRCYHQPGRNRGGGSNQYPDAGKISRKGSGMTAFPVFV